MASMPLTRVDILVWDDGHAIARKILEDGVYMIGRDPGCTLQLVSDRISREHARVIVHDDSVVVEDLGSSNGMYFDGRRTRTTRPPWFRTHSASLLKRMSCLHKHWRRDRRHRHLLRTPRSAWTWKRHSSD